MDFILNLTLLYILNHFGNLKLAVDNIYLQFVEAENKANNDLRIQIRLPKI